MFQVFQQSLKYLIKNQLIHVLVYFEVTVLNIYQLHIQTVLNLLIVLVLVHIDLVPVHLLVFLLHIELVIQRSVVLV